MLDLRALGVAVVFAVVAGVAVYQPWVLTGLLGVALAGFALWARHAARDRPEPRIPQAPPRGMETGIPLGEYVINGAPYCPKLADTHVTIGGVPDSGKSNTVNCMLVSLARDPNVQILGIDPKGGLELGPWEPRLAALATRPEEWLPLLRALEGEIDRRQRIVRAWRAPGSDRPAGRRKIGPDMGLPRLVLIIDETHLVLNRGTPEQRKAVVACLEELTAAGRALGLTVILATQKPAADSIPTTIRDNAKLGIAHQCRTPEATDTILGRTATTRGATAHLIQEPGVACVWDPDERRFRWVRVRYITDEEVRMTVSITDDLCRPWNLPVTRTPPARRNRPPRQRRRREEAAL